MSSAFQICLITLVHLGPDLEGLAGIYRDRRSGLLPDTYENAHSTSNYMLGGFVPLKSAIFIGETSQNAISTRKFQAI